MDVYDRLNQLTATVRSAKPMPMSASCLVNRAEMLETLERLRDELPTTLNHADACCPIVRSFSPRVANRPSGSCRAPGVSVSG